MKWNERPARNLVAREAALAIEPILAEHFDEDSMARVLNAVELVIGNALKVVAGGTGGRRDPMTGIVRPSNLQYAQPARTREEAIRDAGLVAQGRHIPSPRESFEKHGEDRTGEADPAEQQKPPAKKVWRPPSWA